MNTRAIRSTLIGSLGVALALVTGSAFARPIYALTDLGTLGGTFGHGVALNASGQATGTSTTASEEPHAFLWNGTTMLDLGTLGGLTSGGSALNASGQVTGFAETTDGSLRTFLWDGTTMQDLGTLAGGSGSSGSAINASGQVTGTADTADGEAHAFLWDGTTMQDLGTLGGTDSVGVAINASGQVTGSFITAGGETHAFLWDGTTLQDLNALIDPADPLQPFITLVEGVDINDLGQILANGFDSRTGENHAYLLTPVSVSEPGTLESPSSCERTPLIPDRPRSPDPPDRETVADSPRRPCFRTKSQWRGQ